MPQKRNIEDFLKNTFGEEISPTLSPQICIKSVSPALALTIETAAEEFNKNIVCIPIITSAIYQILGLACQRQRKRVVSHKFKYISEGIELMENNSDKTLNEIAQICGVSEGYFRKLFREYSGGNPIEFRQKYRIEKAKRMNFFGGAHLKTAKTADPRPARTLRNCRGITRRLVIGYRDSAHSSSDSLGDNLCGRHLKTRTGRQAAVYM